MESEYILVEFVQDYISQCFVLVTNYQQLFSLLYMKRAQLSSLDINEASIIKAHVHNNT